MKPTSPLSVAVEATAATLEMSVASVHSAHRARSTLREEMPDRRLDWTPISGA